MSGRKRVLFLCTGNSARSQMAEGLLRHLAGDRYEISSAGTRPKGLNPHTVEVMKEVQIDVSSYRSKDLQEFIDQSFDYVITVCDRAREECPVFSGAEAIHWAFDDPAEAEHEKARPLQAFRRVRDEIHERLRLFLAANDD